MFHTRFFLASVGLGAALMYFYDPLLGRSRRARLRDRAQRLADRARRIESRMTQPRPRLH